MGLIGCGEIGRLRAAAIERTSGVRLAAVSDIDPERAGSIAKPHSASIDRDWRELIRRPELNAVIVSTPPSMHAEMVVAALGAGKHVLCEKPLGRSVEECRIMVEAARTSNRFLATGFNYRFYPSVEKARALLDSGIIGELDHVRSYTGYSAKDHNHAWLHDAEVMGGGSLRDNGIHLLDLTCYFLGDVAEIQGAASGGIWNFRKCEDNGYALLRSATGKMASVESSWTEWRGYRFQVELHGNRGCIRISCFPMVTEVVSAKELGGSTTRKKYFFPFVHFMEHLRSYRWVVVESFIREFHEFRLAALGQTSKVATGADGLLTIQIAEESALRFQSQFDSPGSIKTPIASPLEKARQ